VAPGRIPNIAPEQLSAAQRDAMEALQRGRGRIPTPYRVWLQSPALVGRMEALGTHLAHGTSLSASEIELAILLVAQHWTSDYVYRVHRRDARDAGVREAVIAAIDAGTAPPCDDPRSQAIVAIVAALAIDARVSDEIFAAGEAALGHAGIADLLALLGYYTAVAIAMKLYDVPPPPDA
jgi:4-carboxymuconolactone decarboxylase